MGRRTEGRYLISIDGGGSKTGVCVYDCRRKSSESVICGGGNYKTHGIETVRERIFSGLRELIPNEKDIPAATRFLVMGLSGCDSSRDFEIYTEMMLSAGFAKEKMLICNDSEMIFRSVTEAPGICTVAGTGTIALSFERNGRICRAGGWGAPISDEGSGYWIGAEIIRHYLNYVDGIGRSDVFFGKFRGCLLCGSDTDAAAMLASLDTANTAKWAKHVCDAAAENELCRKIVAEAAEKTARLTASVYRKSGFESQPLIRIAEAGSLFKNQLYEQCFRNHLRNILPVDNYEYIRSEGIPAEEGIRLAMKMANESVTTQS